MKLLINDYKLYSVLTYLIESRFAYLKSLINLSNVHKYYISSGGGIYIQSQTSKFE